MPPDRGWLGLDGTPRFEGLSPLPPAGGFVAFRANDRLFGRTVRLVFGGEELLGKAWLAGRLEHPAAVTIHEAGLTPQGKAFAATTDVSAASPLGERGVRDTLRALAQAAEALAHAAGRGLARATILPDEILVFPDGSARLDGVLGWREAKDGDALAGVRSLQEILAQTLERTKSPDALLAALARHPYPTAAVLAADLRAWLEGRPLSVARDPVFRRLVRFSKKRPGLAAASLGTLVAAAGLSLFGASESRLAAGREAQAREIAASQDERRTDELLAEGVGLVSEVLSLDRERALVLARIEKRYHEVDAPHPAPDEVELASELSRLSAERDALARPARAALAGVLARRPGDGRASEGLRTLETGELEHL
ncbi:MAG: hypothetical protein HY720_19085, partial [Planctomycetes bacterium]|nr:hypothetical protein [Planctomycetota bacterium]